MKLNFNKILLAGLLAAASSFAFAQNAVESKLEVMRVVTKDGKEVLEPAGSAKPGDILQYVATYTNKSKATVSKLEATLPIPANTELIPASIKPAGAKASLGGSNFADLPIKRKVKQADGKEVETPVANSEYRSLRWYPDTLAAGANFVASARVKVSDVEAPKK